MPTPADYLRPILLPTVPVVSALPTVLSSPVQGSDAEAKDLQPSLVRSFPDDGAVLQLIGKQRKNMRFEYLTRVVNGPDRWVLQSDLMRTHPALVKSFNASLASENATAAGFLKGKLRPAAPPLKPVPAPLLPAAAFTSLRLGTKPTVKPLTKPTVPVFPATDPADSKHSTPEPFPSEVKHESYDLPPFKQMPKPTFKWAANCDGTDFIRSISKAYDITVKWPKNVFKLPSGSSGKTFVKAFTRLLEGYGLRSPLESIAFKALAVITPLLLQKPAGKLTYRDTSAHLLRRLKLWDEGKIDELLRESITIQTNFVKSKRAVSDTTLAKRFATMVFNNNYKGAMSLVTSKGKGGILPLNAKTKSDMISMHPQPAPVHPDALFAGPLPTDTHPIFYSALDGNMIKRHTLRTTGGAGISQQEDVLWHKMVTAHKDTSAALTTALATVAQRLVTEFVDPVGIEALLANRGIAIDKCPGLRPVGVGEIARRIIGKAVMEVTGKNVQEAVGSIQLCAGHPVGVEAAIHTMRGFLDNDSSDGILLIDADNAFNRVNRAVALWNVQYICPSMKHVLINFYRSPTRIFMNGEGNFELLSQEGTTQGCPLAMAMYALALVPLVKRLLSSCNQVWFADDATGCDEFTKLRSWFDLLLKVGPLYGYYPKPSKCILLTKPDREKQAREIFKGTAVDVRLDGSKDKGIEIVTTGTRHLGAAVGTQTFQHEYIKKKVDGWIDCVESLATIAETEPHAAFAAYTHCLQGNWTFLCRTMPGTAALFQPLEDVIRKVFIPKLTRKDVNDLERDLLSLPARHGGLGIVKPTELSAIASVNSLYVSEPLVRLVKRQEFALDPEDLLDRIKILRNEVDKGSEERHLRKLGYIMDSDFATTAIKTALKASTEKGASSWVTAYPNYDHATVLHKGEFVDAICIRYGWPLPRLPTECKCGKPFDVQHALDCMLGGFRIIQHNETRDVVAFCMKEAGFNEVELEPQLQELTGEQFKYKTTNKESDARSDIKCNGFWSEKRQAYFDVKVVSPFARSYSHLTAKALYKLAEGQKQREYGPRIREVEHGDFTPLVFTCAGGIAPQSSMVIKRLAEKLSAKQKLPISIASGWLRCRLSFALLRTTILCVRGTRSRRVSTESNIELAVSAAHMDY